MTTIDTSKTVADIAAGSLAAVKLFERHGIDYCCGGRRPLADVCRERGLDVATVESELREAIDAAEGSDRDWNKVPLGELIDHVVERHHIFLRRELPGIEARLEKVYRVYNQRYGETFPGLPEVFAGMQEELLAHLAKEERVLFPAIKECEKAALSGASLPPSPFGTVANPIRMMELEHEETGRALAKIREITNNYETPAYACVTYRALMSGFQELEQDIHLHIHLENNILFPRVIELERHGR